MNCLHRLQQKRITDFLPDHPKSMKQVNYWLDLNKALPRKRHTLEIDVFSWKEPHWGALAIEEKSQRRSPKTLCVSEDIRLYSSKAELREGANNLFMQCQGAGCLGNAYAAANYINATVVPVGVVDYNIKVYGTPANWAFHKGVFFVNHKYFEPFLQQFLQKDGWMRNMAYKAPELTCQ